MTVAPATRHADPVDLSKFAWLSIATAVVAIALKLAAWWMTQSVGLLSDAAETVVNLVAAVVALIALKVSIKGPDRSHNFGHTKAEYFSAAIEGSLIFVAAIVIIYEAAQRLLHPRPVENLGIGLLISVVASILNGAVAFVLLRAGARHRSLTLQADGKHLVADVYTSAGVIVGVALVGITRLLGWDCWWLDPLVAIVVGLNIIRTGYNLLRESSAGLMDASMTREENEELAQVLHDIVLAEGTDDVAFHALRTRVSGRRRFAEVHVLVPGEWSVQRGHDLCERVEDTVHGRFDDLSLICHLEPIEDPVSYADIPPAHIPVHDDLPPSSRVPADRLPSGDAHG